MRFIPPHRISRAPIITFGPSDPPLSSYRDIPWEEAESRTVEFFPDTRVRVFLTSVRYPELRTLLTTLSSQTPIVMDLEWLPDQGRSLREPPCLYQFCSSHTDIVLVRDLEPDPSPVLAEFLTTNSFVAKGTSIDIRKLVNRYGPDFDIQLEDVEATRLKPNGHSVNFADMVAEFVGQPSAPFKRKEVAVSNWRAETLTGEQVLYAAFDVISLFLAYPQFPLQTPFLSQNCRFRLLKNADLLDGALDLPIKMPTRFSFRSALIASVGPRVTAERCAICRAQIGARKAHIWNEHSDELFELFKWRFDIALAINDITVNSGKLCFPGHPKGFGSFTAYYQAWRSEARVKIGPRIPCKELFVKYLEKTQRINNRYCGICKSEMDDIPEHCWEQHSDIMVEWLPSGSVPLAQMNEHREAVDAAWHFVFRLRLYRLIGKVCECAVCGWRFLGPVSLVCHALMKHCRIRIAPRDVTRAERSRDLARDLIACSAVFPSGWDVGIDNCCLWMADINETPIVCKDCRMAFQDLVTFRAHLMRKHLLVEQITAETQEAPKVPHEIQLKSPVLYVRGFTAEMTDEQLLSEFGRFGRVRSARVQRDPNTRESKLFGFVSFELVDDAQKCIRESVLLRFDGKPAYVTEKVTQAERQREEGGMQQGREFAEILRRKITGIKPQTLQFKLLGSLKKISEQQMAVLVDDDDLFQKWVQVG